MTQHFQCLVAGIVASVVCLGIVGCGPRGSTTTAASDPLVHYGSVDGYKFEMHGDPKIKTEQEADPKGEGSHPKVTCGVNWFSVRDARLFANGKDYGAVIKRGDTITVATDGTVFVNGERIAALPLVEPPPPNPGGAGNDLAK